MQLLTTQQSKRSHYVHAIIWILQCYRIQASQQSSDCYELCPFSAVPT